MNGIFMTDSRPEIQRGRGVVGTFQRLAAVFLIATLPMCSCAVGITHDIKVVSRTELSGIELAPDTERVAIGVNIDHIHEPNAIGSFPDGGMWIYEKRRFEVLVFDLRRRGSPVRLASREREPEASYNLMYWDSSGIYIRQWYGGSAQVFRIDPTSRRSVQLSSSDAKRADDRAQVLHPGSSEWDDLHRRHVYASHRQFFLWNPVSHRAEHLFDLPEVWDGHREYLPMQAADWRRESVYDGVLREWDVAVRRERDSVRVTLETYAPRPGDSVRPYKVVSRLAVLDTVAIRRDVIQAGSVALPTTTRLLAPTTSHVDAVIAYSDLRRELLPYARYLREYPPESVTVTVAVKILPEAIRTDFPVDVTKRRLYSEQAVEITIPARGLLPRRWARKRREDDRHL
jgi:hypothetical protein